MSIVVAHEPKNVRDPGARSCSETTPASTSALEITSVPARLIGDVAARIGITMNPHGTPAFANSTAASSGPPSYTSGDTEHWNALTIGRSYRSSSPPAAIVAISTTARACSGVTAVIMQTCLPVLFRFAWKLFRGSTGTGNSRADAGCQM